MMAMDSNSVALGSTVGKIQVFNRKNGKTQSLEKVLRQYLLLKCLEYLENKFFWTYRVIW